MTSTEDTNAHHRHHRHESPPPPHPTRRRSSFAVSIPTPDLFGSIASGAHYVGAMGSARDEHPGGHRRATSVNVDDPKVEDAYREVMEDLKEMFCGRTTLEILNRRWKRDAVFEDPLTRCEGFEEYAPQWFALGKFFKSERVSARIISAALDPNKLIFTQVQTYTLKLFGFKKTITSMVIVDLDEDMRITHLVDQWNGEKPPTRWGASLLRRFNAKFTPWIVRIPKH
ncbi:hypothetical protein C8Q75DRAFT_801682 [Abortiporus biennis]|nr:hypothetical protein C8Q75DRAFT_801682 [Abortiporus biennis]